MQSGAVIMILGVATGFLFAGDNILFALFSAALVLFGFFVFFAQMKKDIIGAIEKTMLQDRTQQQTEKPKTD
jgi:hypothetical protein